MIINSLSFIVLFFSNFAFAEVVIFAPFKENGFSFSRQEVDFSVQDYSILTWQNEILDLSKIELSGSKDVVRFKNIPKLLLGQSLVVRDSRKKSVWSQDFDSLQTEISLPSSVLSKLTKVPFFSFCIVREVGPQRISICSLDYSLRRSGTQSEWTPRREGLAPSLEINGNSVQILQGQIILNDTRNPVYFSLRTTSLHLLEIEISADYPPAFGVQKIGSNGFEVINQELTRFPVSSTLVGSPTHSIESINSIGLKSRSILVGPLDYFAQISFKAQKTRRWALPQLEIYLALPESTKVSAPGGSIEPVKEESFNYQWVVGRPPSGLEALKTLQLTDQGKKFTLKAGIAREPLWFLGLQVFNVDSGTVSISKRYESLELFFSYSRFFNTGAIIDSQVRLGFTTGIYKVPASWDYRAGLVADQVSWDTGDKVSSVRLKLSAEKDFNSRWFETFEASLEGPVLLLNNSESKAQHARAEGSLRQSLFDSAWDLKFGLGYEIRKIRSLEDSELGFITQLNFSF